MKNRNSLRLITLLIAILMTVCLTACGGGSEEAGTPEDEQMPDSMQEESIQEESVPEETGPEEVSAIDTNVTYELQGSYYDEEGYDREYTGTITEAAQFVDCKVFTNADASSTSCLLVLHFRETLEISFRDAQGNEMDSGIDWLNTHHGIYTHEVTNVDTGETEALDDFWKIDESELDSRSSSYEGLEDYLREVGYEEFNYGDEEDDIEGIRPYSNADHYYFYVVEHGKGTIVYRAVNDAVYDDDLTVTSSNFTEQIMRIEL